MIYFKCNGYPHAEQSFHCGYTQRAILLAFVFHIHQSLFNSGIDAMTKARASDMFSVTMVTTVGGSMNTKRAIA